VTSSRVVLPVEILDESVAPRTTLGESPRWAAGRWWWLDAHDGRVWSSPDLASAPTLLADAGRRVSLVQPAGPDLAIIADAAVLRPLGAAAGSWEPGPALPLGLPDGWVLNDGCADAEGRLWVGAVPPDRGADGVLLWTDGERVTVAHEGIAISNGMAWGADGATLFHADTGRSRLLAHRVDPRRGVVLGTEVLRSYDDGLPDGVAVDRDGGVWIAVYGTGQVRRIGGSGPGELVVEVPTPQVTSVALGGPDGCDMLITTAREGFTADDSRRDPAAGRLFRARSPHAGLEAPLVRRNGWTR
jgi:sugar lactone lactonase YvrE